MALLLASSVPALAGKLEKAFEALKVHNYFLAKELLHEQISGIL